MNSTARRGWPALAALLLYLAYGTALVWPALFGDQVVSACASFVRKGPFPAELRERAPDGLDFYSDAVCCFDPWLRFAADAFAADGRIPLWKPTASAGAPFVGNGQSAVFFLPNLLALLCGAPPVVHALTLLFKLVGGAFCAWLLARHLRLSFAAAWLCGLCFGFGGFQMGFSMHPLTNVSMLLPLLVLAADRLVLRPSFPRVGQLAAVAALQHFGGHPETVFHCQVAVVLVAGARALSLRRDIGRAAAARRWICVLAALGLGGAVAAIQLLPLLEYMSQSAALQVRGQELGLQALAHPLAAACFGAALAVALLALRRLATAERGLGWSALVLFGATVGCVFAGLHAGLEPTFVVLLSPDWFGGPVQYLGPAVYIGESSPFVGAALPLAALGLLQGRPRGPVLAAGVVALIGLLEAKTAPLIDDLLRVLPIFRLAFNARLGLLALLAIAVLAGYGLDALGQAALRTKSRWRLALAVLAPSLGSVVALACAVRVGKVPSSNYPGLPKGVDYVEARLLPGPQVDPLFPEELARADVEPCKVFCGIVLPTPTTPHDEIQLVYGRAGTPAETRWKTEAGVEVFRATVPLHNVPPEQTRVRIRLLQAGRLVAVSGLMADPDDDGGTWLPFPARPAAGTTVGPLLLLALTLGLAVLAPVGGAGRGGLRVALPALVAASLWTFDSKLVALLPEEFYYPPSAAVDVLRGASPDGRSFAVQADLMTAEIPTYYGVSDLRGYDGLGPAHVVRLLDAALGRSVVPGSSVEVLATGGPDFALLGLMSVRYLLNPVSLPPGFARVPLELPVTLVENPHFVPRARLVGSAVVEPDDDRALALLHDADVLRSRRVVLAAGEPREGVDADIGSARIVIDRPDRVDVQIDPLAPGWLVLTDTFFPGWIARVDGLPREIERANVAFRAVAVRPGEHTVEFRYEPLSYRAGAIVSLLASLALGVGCLVSRRRGVTRAVR